MGGKGGDRAFKNAGPADNEVLIDGKYYDVTNLKNPGGSVIKFYTGNGIDATQAFYNFHVRSSKADKYMASLPQRDADPAQVEATRLDGQTALLKDFDKLTEELRADGFFDPAPFHVFYRVFEVVAMYAVGLYLLFNVETISIKVGGIFIMGLASGRCGWLMHEGGHYSLTGHIPTDQAIQVFAYGFGCGMSGSWWRNQHNKHHATPQKLKHDVDLDTLPLVAFNRKVVKSDNWWLRMQGHLFAPVTCLLVALGWQLYLHPRHSIRRGAHMELFWYAARYLCWSFAFSHFSVCGSLAAYFFLQLGGRVVHFLQLCGEPYAPRRSGTRRACE